MCKQGNKRIHNDLLSEGCKSYPLGATNPSSFLFYHTTAVSSGLTLLFHLRQNGCISSRFLRQSNKMPSEGFWGSSLVFQSFKAWSRGLQRRGGGWMSLGEEGS